jgi:predicted DNA-binding antitoxin AbrB/MazE fold protein
MAQHLRAVYEDGVFRPLEPVRLEEHQEVTLVLEVAEDSMRDIDDDRPIWEVAAELVRNIPEEELDSVPTDGAAHHDYYLYGVPKQD